MSRVLLRNMFQHTHSEVPISGNVIGVIGTNGSGKSNWLNSVRFALTGEIPDGYTKDELTTFSSESDGYAEVTFTHNGVTTTVHRSVGTGDTWLRSDGQSKITGIRAVNSAMYALTGLDPDVAKYAFVRQKELDSALFELPSQREKAFQRLCGLGDAQGIHDGIGQYLLNNLEAPPDYATMLAIIDVELATLRQQAAEARAAANAAPAPGSAEQASADMLFAAALRDIATALDARDRAAELLPRCEQAAARARAEEVRLGELCAKEDIGTLEAAVAGQRAAVGRIQSDRALLLARDAAERALEPVGGMRARIDALSTQLRSAETARTSTLAALSEKTGAHNTNVALLTAVRASLAVPGRLADKCPTCDQAIRDPAEVERALAAKVAAGAQELQRLHADASAAAASVARVSSELAELQRSVSTLERNAETARARAASADQAALTADDGAPLRAIAELEARRSAWLADRAAHVAAATGATNAEAQLKAAAAQHASTSMAVDVAIGRCAQMGRPVVITGVTSDMLRAGADGVIATAANVQAAAAAYATIIAHADARERALASLEASRVDVANKLAAGGNTLRVRQTLMKVREWFHYRNGPSHLATHILRLMNKDLNAMLAAMGVPFRAAAQDSSLAYKCVFTDGRAQSANGLAADKLSGGEKGMLAVAFRLAVFRMFAAKIGLLSLDEPTAYLDDANVSNFCRMLEALKTLAGDMDTQILLSTHERQCMPYLDTVVDLGRPGQQPG